MNNENESLVNNLQQIFQKVKAPNTLIEAQVSFRTLITDAIQNPKEMNVIFQQMTTYYLNLHKADKKELFDLLPTLYQSLGNPRLLYPYMDKILVLLQSSISEDNITIYQLISKSFSEIGLHLISSQLIVDSQVDKEVIDIYEKMKMFCINNMKTTSKASQIVGTLCLTNFIEGCSLNYKSEHIKSLWETIINLIGKQTFNAKLELLNCLISLIFSSEAAFRPYATVTLYKILDYLTDTDWLKRKLALNVVYTLVFYCKAEIIPLHEYIIEFLKVLKNDKVAEVREVCMQTLKYFNDYTIKPIKEIETKAINKPKIIKTKSHYNKNTSGTHSIRNFTDSSISKEDDNRRAMTPSLKNNHSQSFQKTISDKKQPLSIQSRRYICKKKPDRASSVPRLNTHGDLSTRMDCTLSKIDNPQLTLHKNSKSTLNLNNNNTKDMISNLTSKIDSLNDIHSKLVSSMNETIQSLTHRIRLLENELDGKSKKEKRKTEFKNEKLNKNYDKAFQIALELNGKYLIQIIKKLKKEDYNNLTIEKFENSINVLLQDLDIIVHDLYHVFFFIHIGIMECKLPVNSDIQKKIISSYNEAITEQEAYHIQKEDLELMNDIIQHFQ